MQELPYFFPRVSLLSWRVRLTISTCSKVSWGYNSPCLYTLQKKTAAAVFFLYSFTDSRKILVNLQYTAILVVPNPLVSILFCSSGNTLPFMSITKIPPDF